MNSVSKLLDFKRAGYVVASFAVLLATVLPSLAMAAQVTERSIALSNSSVNATDVEYTVNFKSVGAAGAFVVDFCTTPTFDTTCTAPTDLDTTGVSTATAGFSAAIDGTNRVVVTGTVAASTAISVALASIDNPSVTGPFYARIVTFTNAAGAEGYESDDPGAVAAPIDNGSVAMSITPTFGVTGAVLETLVFCASGSVIDPSCTGTPTSPSLSLGTNGVLGNALSEGTVYTQISTNASKGAVVNLKSSTVGCGGLLRAGADDAASGCGISPQIVTGRSVAIAADAAEFGVRFAGLDNGTGAINLAANYGTTAHYLNYVTGDATGVTSTYGAPIYDTDEEPISNGEANLVFGANISNDTPAGTYSANLSLIATGKF